MRLNKCFISKICSLLETCRIWERTSFLKWTEQHSWMCVFWTLLKVMNNMVMVSLKGLKPSILVNGLTLPFSISKSRGLFHTPRDIYTIGQTHWWRHTRPQFRQLVNDKIRSKVKDEDGFTSPGHSYHSGSCVWGKHLLVDLICLSLWKCCTVSQGISMKLF